MPKEKVDSCKAYTFFRSKKVDCGAILLGSVTGAIFESCGTSAENCGASFWILSLEQILGSIGTSAIIVAIWILSLELKSCKNGFSFGFLAGIKKCYLF